MEFAERDVKQDSGQLCNRIERLNKILEPIDDLRSRGQQLLMGGDLNIY